MELVLVRKLSENLVPGRSTSEDTVIAAPEKDLTIKEPLAQEASLSGRIDLSRGHILKNVVSNWSYLIINAVVAFLMTPFIVRHLGDSAYGIWALVLQLTGYMGVVDVGLRSALIRFGSSAHATGDTPRLNRLLSTTIMIYGVMAPVSLTVGVLLAQFALPRMHIEPAILGKAQITLLIAALIIACDFLFATFHATLAGLSRWDLINTLGITGILLRTGLTVLFILRGYGLIALALIQLSIALCSYLIEVILVRRNIPSFRLVWAAPDREQLRPVLAHSWYSFLLSLANRVNYQVDSIVIALFLPISEVTFYVIGLRLIEYLRDLLNSTTMVASPLVSSLEAVGDSDRVVATLIRGTKYSLVVAFLGVAGYLTLGKAFITLWMGPRFTAPSGTVLIILTIGVAFCATQYASGHVLYGLSRHRINLKWTLIESAVNLVLSLLLVRRFGILGVAAGTSLSNFLVKGWLYPRAVLRDLNVSWKAYVLDGVLMPMIPASAFVFGVMVFRSRYPIVNYREFIVSVACGLIPFAIFLWFFALDHKDRAVLRQKFVRSSDAHD